MKFFCIFCPNICVFEINVLILHPQSINAFIGSGCPRLEKGYRKVTLFFACPPTSLIPSAALRYHPHAIQFAIEREDIALQHIVRQIHAIRIHHMSR